MSGGTACNCLERFEPLTAQPGANKPPRLWRNLQYRCNHSAFNGYHYTPSDWSSIVCLRCGACWRTKAGYADELTALEKEFRTSHVTPEQIAAWGRTPHKVQYYGQKEEVPK